MNLVIKTKDLSKKYKDNHGLLPTNFELHKGEVCALIGRIPAFHHFDICCCKSITSWTMSISVFST